jgi:hypothetical protein
MIYDTSKELEVNKLLSRLDALLSKKCVIELTEKKKTRTLSQNAYLHVCITLFAIETGNNLDDMKHELKRSCHFMHTFDGEKFKTVRTRDLDTKRLTDFIDWIRNYASMQGCYIPTADEYKLNQFEIDKEIAKNKEFL